MLVRPSDGVYLGSAGMTPRKTRPDPNVQDPFGEPTIGRRVWACYLAKGYKRFSFAKALGVSYSTVDAWDCDKSVPSLELLESIVKLLEVPVQNLIFGHAGAPQGSVHASGLTREARLALLNEIGASPAQRAALAAHEDSIEGRYQLFTREYVIQWLAAYDEARSAGASAAEAGAAALAPAITARAAAGAVATAGQARTLSRDEVRAINARAHGAADEPPKPARTTPGKRPKPKRKR